MVTSLKNYLQKNKPIIKYSILWSMCIFGFIISIVYTLYSGNYAYWFFAYLYTRIMLLFANPIGLHRYFSHRSFNTGSKRHKFLAWVSILAGSGSPYTWAMHHRHHHKYSDTPKDLHSPRENAWRSGLGIWAIMPVSWWTDVKEVHTIPRDLYKDSTVMFIHNHYYKIWSTILTVALLAGGWKFAVFYVLAPVGWNLMHGALTNCVNHQQLIGSYRNFNTDDFSQNHKWLSLYLLGEGLHNNHHAHPTAYRFAKTPSEVDFISKVIEKLLKI